MNNQTANSIANRFIKQFDRSLIFRTAQRVMAELWIPAIGAMLAMCWGKQGWNIFTFEWMADFFTTLFFFGAFFRYWQIARKLVVDEINHERVVAKQDQVFARLEAVGEKLEGLATGGNGFAYVHSIEMDSNSNINCLLIKSVGKYPLHDLQLRITKQQTAQNWINAANKGNIFNIKNTDFVENFKIIQPNTIVPVPCNIVVKKEVDTYVYQNWSARNGSWSGKLYLAWVDGRWRTGGRISIDRIKPGESFEYADEEYPKDEFGKPTFPN